MAEFMELKYFAHVCARGEGDYKYWVFGYNSTCDSVCFSELRNLHYMCVVCVPVCTDAYFWGVGQASTVI
jgi:hypothetical protein